MNKVILVGRLTRDPETRHVNTNNGNGNFSMTSFTLAVDRPRARGQQQNEADFISCEITGERGENLVKYSGKGRRIAVEGSWRTGSYTDKNGSKVYTNVCRVSSWEFADSKPGGNQQQGGYQQPQQGGYQNNQQGGYQPQPQQGGYQNNQQGGYQPQPQQGGYQNNQQGGYQPQPQQGGYQNNQQGGYSDGFLPAGLDDELPFN